MERRLKQERPDKDCLPWKDGASLSFHFSQCQSKQETLMSSLRFWSFARGSGTGLGLGLASGLSKPLTSTGSGSESIVAAAGKEEVKEGRNIKVAAARSSLSFRIVDFLYLSRQSVVPFQQKVVVCHVCPPVQVDRYNIFSSTHTQINTKHTVERPHVTLLMYTHGLICASLQSQALSRPNGRRSAVQRGGWQLEADRSCVNKVRKGVQRKNTKRQLP